jgi:LPXTG-site transpeptidase (sortase) family protein
MKRNEAIRFVVLRSLGNFLVLFSLYGVLATFGPALSAEAKFLIIQARGVTFTVPRGQGNVQAAARATRATFGRDLGFADVLAGSKNQTLTPKDPLFSILIPKIGASAKVFPNVDPDNPDIFLPVLQQGIAHAKGSVFPGHPGNTYLFAHSTDNWWDVGRYNAVFYTLGNLSEKDEIIVFFENRRYDYVVTQKLIADPQDVTLLTAKHKGPQQLVLQTCWPPGTTWKRLYVIAKPK